MKRLIYLVLLVLPINSIAQNTFTLQGKVGYNNAAIAILTYKVDGISKSDTAKVKNGVFTFTGSVQKIAGANLDMRYYAVAGFTNTADNLAFYLENKNIIISSSNYVKNSKITGSPLNDENIKMQEYVKQANAQSSKAKSDVYAQYALKHTDSFIGLAALMNSIVRDVDENTTQAIFDKFPQDLKNMPLGKNIQSTINAFKNTRPGSIAMNFTQNNEKGIPVSLSDFKGKYVLIDFWASWCVPCRTENPNLVATFNEFKNKNFTVLGVSLDRIKENWLKAIKDDRLAWAQVSDLQYWDNAVSRMYAVKGIPTNILVGPDGKIVGNNLFGPQLKQRLTELILAK